MSSGELLDLPKCSSFSCLDRKFPQFHRLNLADSLDVIRQDFAEPFAQALYAAIGRINMDPAPVWKKRSSLASRV